MEEVWNIKSIRNNLVFISIITILLILFSQNNEIKEINILSLIKITDINTFKFLSVLLIANMYVFYRYYTYFIKSNLKLDYDLLFKFILEKHRNQIQFIRYHSSNKPLEEFKINYQWKLEYKSRIFTYFDPILSNKNITSSLLFREKYIDVELLCITDEDTSDIPLALSISKYSFINLWIFFIFYIKEKNVMDYYLPFLLGIVSIVTLINKILCN